MSVRKLFLSASLVSVFVAGSLVLGFAQGKDDDPFFDHDAKGETVKVLPTPARLKSQNPNGPSFAEPSSDAQVFSASYGSGNLTDHGGPQIGPVQFAAIYWNAAVANAVVAPNNVVLSEYIDGFIGAYGSQTQNYLNDANSDFSIVQQYGSRAFTTPGIVKGGFFTAGGHDVPSATIKDSEIQLFLAGYLGGSGAPAVDDNTIYGVYFPSGVTIQLNGSSCSSFCGYHNHFTIGSHQIKYAVFPYLDCSACKAAVDSTVRDMLTVVSSHEIREATTDPQLNAWFDRRGYEADDKCAWHNLYNMNLGGYLVQPEYSNGGTVNRSGFTATYPGPGCIVPSAPTGGGGGGGGNGHGHGHLTTNGRGGGGGR